jgi:beta-lactamase superfamily II metal-dependent hydrolase
MRPLFRRSGRLRRWVILGALALVAPSLCGQATGGIAVPAWTPGTLDIHQIQTGRGNAAFLVFPDGTTLLVDAGAIPERKGPAVGPLRPNASRSPAAWLAHYIRQCQPPQAERLDYLVVTHFHDDHMGAVAELARLLPVGVIIDRGTDPPPPPYPVVRDYFEFRRRYTGAIEKIDVGRASQIVARHAPAAHGPFEVRTVAGNGLVWTGQGETSVSPFPADWRTLPKADQPDENNFSVALRLRYGRFTYFTGGDLLGVPLDDLPGWHDLETPVARAVGPVDAAVLNHHGFLDSTNSFFLKTLDPRVVVIPAWHATHPDHSVLRRLRSPRWKPAPPDLFITSLLDAPRAVFSYLSESFRTTEGHILIRVAPGGLSYHVIVLDNTVESPVVSAVFGPYLSRGR